MTSSASPSSWATAIAAVAFHAIAPKGAGPLPAVAGWLTGVLLFSPIFLLRGIGAGDLKLLGAFGAWLGPMMALSIGLWGAIAGGVLAVVVALAHGYLAVAFRNLRLLLTHWRATGITPLDAVSLDKGAGPRLAYAIPLSLGLMVALWTR